MCYYSGQWILAVDFFIFSADGQKRTENPQDPCHILAFFLAQGLQLCNLGFHVSQKWWKYFN